MTTAKGQSIQAVVTCVGGCLVACVSHCWLPLSCCLCHMQAWWQDPKNVELVQFMGKDNVPFHTVIFPATLLGTGQEWTMMKKISVTEYLNYEGGKFSKSRGVGVFGNDAKETGIPVEVCWHWSLL